MALGKKNEVQVVPESYVHLIFGEKKIGKSTLVADIARQYYGSIEALLAISVGDEDGFKAIDGLIYELPQTWKEFVKIVDELIKNADENNFKIISIDTIDELVSLATAEVMRLSAIETGKKCSSINDAFGGYGRGREKLADLIGDQITRLKRSKYGVFLIGHNKVKTQKEKLGEEYMVMTSNLNSDYFNIFAYKADIVCNIVVEKEVDENKVLTGTTRYMYFRSDGYVDAGSRFAEMPTRVEYGAMNYVNAIKEGILKSLKKNMSESEIAKRAKLELAAKEKSAKQFAASEDVMPIEKRVDIMGDKLRKVTKPIQQKFKQALKDLGYVNLTSVKAANDVEHVEILENILK